MIVDTSALIEFLRGTGSSAHRALARALVNESALWLPAVVVQEVLQGARDKQCRGDSFATDRALEHKSRGTFAAAIYHNPLYPDPLD